MVPIRIVADRDVCIGAGMCALTAPGLFDQDAGDGLVVLKRELVEGEQLEAARNAVDYCPSGAISLESDDRQ
jgi:ferredoxin